MYYIGDVPRFPVPEADDCWECYNMNVLHDGYCPGILIEGVRHYAKPLKVYPSGGHEFYPFQGGRGGR